MSKKITTISLFVFWAIITAILIVGLTRYQNPTVLTNTNVSSTTTPSVMNSVFVNNAIKAGKTLTLNLTEISKHNSGSDCWLLINNKVYDVTSSISSHPGGAGPILTYCGKEATNAFNTKDVGRPHSSNANAMLAQYYIGDLNQTLGQTTLTKKITTITNSPKQPANIVNTVSTTPTTSTTTQATITPPPSTTILDATEVAKHNTASDCWLIINNKVYSVASYLSSHPGGVGAITAYCGRDATTAFNTKGGTGHSAYANSLLGQYYIGDLNQSVSTQQVQQNVQNTNTVTPPPTGRRENDDD